MATELVFAEVDYTSPETFKRTYFGKIFRVWIRKKARRDWVLWHEVWTKNDSGHDQQARYEWDYHPWSWGPFGGYWIDNVRAVA